MQYVTFASGRKLDLIALGRVAIDFNPIDYFKPLSESREFRKYLGGSPANVAVGLARLGGKVGFIGKVSDDRFGDYPYHPRKRRRKAGAYFHGNTFSHGKQHSYVPRRHRRPYA